MREKFKIKQKKNVYFENETKFSSHPFIHWPIENCHSQKRCPYDQALFSEMQTAHFIIHFIIHFIVSLSLIILYEYFPTPSECTSWIDLWRFCCWVFSCGPYTEFSIWKRFSKIAAVIMLATWRRINRWATQRQWKKYMSRRKEREKNYCFSSETILRDEILCLY